MKRVENENIHNKIVRYESEVEGEKKLQQIKTSAKIPLHRSSERSYKINGSQRK